MNEEINTISEEQVLHNKLSFEINQELIHLMKRIVELQQENKQLKDNWNKLKEYTQEKYDNPSWASCGARYVLEKMQELEQCKDE